MQTTEVFTETARWLRYAEEDLITAETLLAQEHIPPRHLFPHTCPHGHFYNADIQVYLSIYSFPNVQYNSLDLENVLSP